MVITKREDVPDRTPKDVCRVKKNSDDDSRTGRWLWWSLTLVVKNLTIQYCTHPDDHIQTSEIYNFAVLKSYGDLIYFELGRNFRLEILIGWGEAETENDLSYFICLFYVCLFVFTSGAWKMFSVICIFLIKNQWFEWKHITFFYQVVMDRVVWGPTYSFFAVQSHQRAMEYINIATS